MNIISGSFSSSGSLIFRSSATFSSGSFEVSLPKGLIPESIIGESINLGVRSENVIISENGAEAKVELIEPLGDETLVFFSYGTEDLLVGKVDADREFAAGDIIHFTFDPKGLHFFDNENGDRLE